MGKPGLRIPAAAIACARKPGFVRAVRVLCPAVGSRPGEPVQGWISPGAASRVGCAFVPPPRAGSVRSHRPGPRVDGACSWLANAARGRSTDHQRPCGALAYAGGRNRDRSLQRFRYGPAAFKIDYALAAPIPWLAQDCARAGTVHVGGSFAEVAQSEREVAAGRPPERPFVLLAQHSVFDSTRAPAGRHTAWAYCHVPNDSKFDMTERMESQIERFAPGFRDRILARHVTTPQALEANNSNLVGGDINGGLANLRQLAARPILSFVPYRTPLRGVYLCSASTPPGGGVHGMAGYHAATAALRREFQVEAGLDASKRTASGNSR